MAETSPDRHRVKGGKPIIGSRIQEHLLELASRTDELRRMIEDEDFKRFTGDNELRERIESIEARLDEEIGRIQADRREAPISDSQWQFGGLLLVLLGVIVQTTGQVLQAMPPA